MSLLKAYAAEPVRQLATGIAALKLVLKMCAWPSEIDVLRDCFFLASSMHKMHFWPGLHPRLSRSSLQPFPG